jgi:Lon protease-like protein
MAPLPMFPLGTVLFPSAVLPLHVFEPRYRALVRDCLAGERELGVVLIERGSEVGGGDVRSDVGTVAHLARADELPDGRWALVTVGARRIRVERWLPDDPYPVADVADWPDPAPGPGYEAQAAAVVSALRRVLALASEAGDATVPATIELSEDPVLAVLQAAAVAPIGPLDGQRLLAAPSPEERADHLEALLADAADVLRLRLGG